MSEKKYTEKQKAFLQALKNDPEGDIRKAMNEAGYSSETAPANIINSLKNEIIEIARDSLTGASIKATYGLISILTNPGALNSRETINAAKEILDRVGIVRTEQVTVNGPQGGVVLLPPKRRSEDEEDE